MKEWHFNVLFFVGVGSVILMFVGPNLGFKLSDNPSAVTGVGLILTYILTQKKTLTKSDTEAKKETKRREEDEKDDV